jgi:alpha-L-fucosidase
MTVNGDSIYGTTYGPVQGMSSLRTTAKGKKVYVHVFDWPSATLEIKGLDAKVIAAHLLATGQSLTFRQDSGKLQVDVARRAPDPNVSTIALNTL